MNNLKILVALALSGLALAGLPAAAQATNFTASSYPASFTGLSAVGNGKLTTEAGTTECRDHFQGSMFASSETLTANWTLSECKWFGFQTWQVNMNGCDLRFRLTGGSADSFTAVTDIVCPTGKTIEVTVGTCAFNFPPQTGLGTVDFTNNTAVGDISMQATVAGLKYAVTKDGFGCPFAGVGEKSGGTYVHSSPVTLDALSNLHIE